MKTLPFSLFAALLGLLLHCAADAADTSSMSAQELAARLSALQQNGNSYVRVRMEVKEPASATTLQLQIKSRRTKSATDVVYQVLWPKERKGEAVLLRKKVGGES